MIRPAKLNIQAKLHICTVFFAVFLLMPGIVVSEQNRSPEAWEKEETPDPLGMPLQFMATSEAVYRGHAYADKAQAVGFNPCGQIVGQAKTVRPVRQVIDEMIEEYLDCVERLNDLLPE